MKRLISLEKKRLRKATIERIREQGETSCKLFWEDLKGMKEQCQIQRVSEEDGLVIEKRKDIFEVLVMHWRGLRKMSQSGEDVPIDNLKSKANEMNLMMEPVEFQEMFTIVKWLKRGKAPGPDGIMRCSGNRMVEVLCSLVNLLMEYSYWPDDWRQSCIVPLF